MRWGSGSPGSNGDGAAAGSTSSWSTAVGCCAVPNDCLLTIAPPRSPSCATSTRSRTSPRHGSQYNGCVNCSRVLCGDGLRYEIHTTQERLYRFFAAGKGTRGDRLRAHHRELAGPHHRRGTDRNDERPHRGLRPGSSSTSGASPSVSAIPTTNAAACGGTALANHASPAQWH